MAHGFPARDFPRTLTRERTIELVECLSTNKPVLFCALGRHSRPHDVELTRNEEGQMVHFSPCENSAYLDLTEEDR